jgi:RNA polymerase sigma-70 factor (ECF subfamily)
VTAALALDHSPPYGDHRLVEALRAGDEAAFAGLVRQQGPMMLRLARLCVGDRAVAEEVVQDTWLGVVDGIDRFEGRSSLKTWIFRILINTAKSRGARESRTAPFSSFTEPGDADESTVEPDRFFAPQSPWPGHWVSTPQRWSDMPEHRLLAKETLGRVARAIEALPAVQRIVVTMRDVEGCSSNEVCEVLGLTEANQRVQLHRGRSRIRRVLERHFDS